MLFKIGMDRHSKVRVWPFTWLDEMVVEASWLGRGLWGREKGMTPHSYSGSSSSCAEAELCIKY